MTNLEGHRAQVFLAYEEARRGLANDEKRLDELRSRTGSLIAATAIATSFLGAEVLSKQGATCLAWIGLACFALSMVCGMWVLVPQGDWRFESNAMVWLDGWIRNDNPITEVELMAKAIDEWTRWGESNRSKIDNLGEVFIFACVFLLAEVGFWAWALAKG